MGLQRILKNFAAGSVALQLGELARAEEPVAEKAAEEGEVSTATEGGEPAENWGDVLQVSGGEEGLNKITAEYKYVLLKWYAPWCGHCKALKEDYIKLAAEVKELVSKGEIALNDGAKVAVAACDGSTESELVTQFGIEGIPSLHWLVNGNKKAEYNGPRTAEGLLNFVKEGVLPALSVLNSTDELETKKQERSIAAALVAFEGAADDAEWQKIGSAVADAPIAATKFVYLPGSTKKVTIFKGVTEEEEAPIESIADEASIVAWLKTVRKPAFGEVNEENFEMYTEAATSGLFWACIDPEESKHAEQLKLAASALVGAAKSGKEGVSDYPYLYVDTKLYADHAKALGCTEYPTIVLQRGDVTQNGPIKQYVKSFAADPAELTQDAVESWLEGIRDGKIEPVPEPDELDAMDEDDEKEDL